MPNAPLLEVIILCLLQAFEWIVRDIHKLRDFVEGQQSEVHDNGEERPRMPGQDDFEILKESPHLGDGKFKLEIGWY